MSAYMLAADLFALPYRDGASYRRGSLLAPLAHGRAIVTTYPRTTHPEMIHGQSVYLTPPGSPEELAQAIGALARETDLRRRLEAGARALAANFTWESIAAQTAAFFRQVTTRS